MSKAPTPEQFAKNNTEDGHQISLFMWCALNASKYPELKWLHHIPNGGSRHIAEAGKLKAMGVKAGVSDLHLPVMRGRWTGLYIELKKLQTAKVKKSTRELATEEQLEFGDFVLTQGYGFVVCEGWEAARDVLVQYLEQAPSFKLAEVAERKKNETTI